LFHAKGEIFEMIRKLLFSITTMLVLVMGLIVSIMIATLLERAYGSSAASVLIYNSWWFEILWIWFSVALFVNLVHFKLWQRKKWDMVLFPFAFSILLFGAILTRHFATKGFLYLREGESSTRFFSSQPYLQIEASNGLNSVKKEYELWLSPLGRPFTKKLKAGRIPLSIRVQRYIVNPEKNIMEDPLGGKVLEIAVFTPHSSSSCFLERGEIDSLFGVHFGFESDFKGNTSFTQLEDRGGEIWVSANRPMIRKELGSERKVRCKSYVSKRFDNFSIYTLDSVSFVLTRYIPKGRIQAIPSEASLFSKENSFASEALDVLIESGTSRRSISLFGGKGIEGKKEFIQLNGLYVELQFGYKPFNFPFSLRLVDFRIERDKDSNKPSQFQSDVVILDPEHNIERPYSIYMNHILRYRGYRVYQYSFDEDEKGSVFLVTRDPGAPVAYAGFFLLIVVILLSFFNPKSRIRKLETEVRKFEWSHAGVILICLMGIMSLGSSAFHVQIEKFYYQVRIFESLGKWLVLSAVVFLLMSVIRFWSKPRFKKLFSILGKFFQWAVLLGFLVFTIGLGIRWVLAGHAPWTNKYESMVFAGWTSLLAGIVLARHSRLPMICGSFLSGIVLLMAHTPSIDSTISPLAPILKSKLLIFHVSIAIVSYGFFAVGTSMAFFNLLALAFPTFRKENLCLSKVSIWSKITEQALWIGLFLLTIGCILGSIWANEAWGRYWGWDPKESWTLIVILSYAVVLHLRFVIRLNWTYWLNVWAFFAFGCLLMTYFGVNRFFSGMHVYGGQSGARFPSMVFWIPGIWIALSLLAYRNRKRL
jgi:cytochrome c-type biogenesis protein CcsB